MNEGCSLTQWVLGAGRTLLSPSKQRTTLPGRRVYRMSANEHVALASAQSCAVVVPLFLRHAAALLEAGAWRKGSGDQLHPFKGLPRYELRRLRTHMRTLKRRAHPSFAA